MAQGAHHHCSAPVWAATLTQASYGVCMCLEACGDDVSAPLACTPVAARTWLQTTALPWRTQGGQPTGEPVVQSGPFVGSTSDEIQQAWVDFKAGLMGRLEPDGSAVRSKWAIPASPTTC